MVGSKTLIATGLGAAAFVGYCIYFDRKRRSDPGYKDGIRQRRRAESRGADLGSDDFDVDLSNPNQIHNFFIREMQLGEMLMEQGQIEEGSQHIANAIVFSGQPQQIMEVLQQAMPAAQFAMVASKLPIASQRLARLNNRVVEQVQENENSVTDDDGKGDLGREIDIPNMQDIMEDDDLE